jgi:hypothetical protein
MAVALVQGKGMAHLAQLVLEHLGRDSLEALKEVAPLKAAAAAAALLKLGMRMAHVTAVTVFLHP